MANTYREVDGDKIIEAYTNGESMTFIAKKFHTYPTTIKRVLEKNNIELRHDTKRPGTLYVQNGEELIEWAKAQERLVTKDELAHILGKKKLSPSYFKKYPELGQYVAIRGRNELQEYSEKLYKWLQDNNISYKPNDRTKLKVSVSALLLEEYEGLAIQIHIKPNCVSKKDYEKGIHIRLKRASENDIFIIWLNKEHFENLDSIKDLLDVFKK